VRLTFLGTRGEIDLRTDRHGRHSSLLVTSRARVVVDCGADWLGLLGGLDPDAVFLTHAHVDHAAGLRDGSPCPVYASAETWSRIRRYPVAERIVVAPRSPVELGGLRLESFPVEHSLRAPAVGYRIEGDGAAFFYVPDLVSIPDRAAALAALDLYVGDGASVARAIVRRRDGIRIGHASIREQLDWCAAEGVPRAVFTHCGSQIVRADGEAVDRVAALGAERGVDARIAVDGEELVLG
jgi:phosphoribosyl 1,2-cyclic phosphodiesterase